MPNFRQRQWLLVVIAIAVIILLTLIAAPNNGSNRNDIGSTYGRNPYGYGAWYEYMSEGKIPIKRWQKPFSQLIEDDLQDVTYIQIRNKIDFGLSKLTPHSLSAEEKEWVSNGNTLVIIGEQQPATAAPFKSLIPHREQALSSHQIKIETTRRHQPDNQSKALLADQYGGVVWSEKVGQGKVIYSTTPYLAANAYQNSLDNYEFLAQLVSQNKTILVDEYIHGYKDKETRANEQQDNILSYLIKTPLFLLFIQIIVIASVATAAACRRFGKPVIPKTAIADNSTAYIEALAGVLEKANSTDFVVETIGKDEQRKLQASLGLGKSLVDQNTLIAAWKKQQNQSAQELNQLLQINQNKNQISEAKLIDWIQKWQKINSQ
jgi:ABC-type transporter Mla MlaB component